MMELNNVKMQNKILQEEVLNAKSQPQYVTNNVLFDQRQTNYEYRADTTNNNLYQQNTNLT